VQLERYVLENFQNFQHRKDGKKTPWNARGSKTVFFFTIQDCIGEYRCTQIFPTLQIALKQRYGDPVRVK